MRNFVYIIGTTDDFGDLEDLKNAYFDGVLGDTTPRSTTSSSPTPPALTFCPSSSSRPSSAVEWHSATIGAWTELSAIFWRPES